MSIHMPRRQFNNAEFEMESCQDGRALLDECHLKGEAGFVPAGRRLAMRLADTADDRADATRLLNRRFAWRGYGAEHHIPCGKSHTTFLASQDDVVVGTVTLGVDSPRGLAVDAEFKDEIDVFRQTPGAFVCELVRFAFETDIPDQQNLAVLFHTVFLYCAANHGCTDVFIEVNPRHRRFYQCMIGFTPIGGLKTNAAVEAPSQLMWLNLAEMAANISSHRNNSDNSRSRSLYPLFLNSAEEATVKRHLANLGKDGGERCGNLIERFLPYGGGVGLAA